MKPIERFCNIIYGGINRSVEDLWISEIRMSLKDCVLDDEGNLESVPDILNNIGFHTAQYPTSICPVKDRKDLDLGQQVLTSWPLEHDDEIFNSYNW